MQRFVIGTGRCGSTLISNMLAMHPDCLMLSEFLGAIDRPNLFMPGAVTGQRVAEMLHENLPVGEYAIHRGRMGDELLYESDDYSTMVIPAVMIAALPMLSKDPERLFGELVAFVRTQPTQPLAQHYLQIIEWLRVKLGRKFWIERSGNAIDYMPELLDFYPKAKYLHVHRDGIDTAMSMRNFFYFQVHVSFFFNPPTRAELELTEIAGKPITADDPISRRIGPDLPSLEKFAEFWSHQVEIGFSAFAHMDKSQLCHIRFEDLIASPRETMAQVADFFEMPDSPGWIDKAAALIHPPASSNAAEKLSAEELVAVQRACRSGQILLGREHSSGIIKSIELIKEVAAEHKRSRLAG